MFIKKNLPLVFGLLFAASSTYALLTLLKPEPFSSAQASSSQSVTQTQTPVTKPKVTGCSMGGSAGGGRGCGGGAKTNKQTAKTTPVNVAERADAEKLTMTFDGRLSPSTLLVQKGKKYALTIDVQADGRGCMTAMLLQGLDENAQQLIAGTPVTFYFKPEKTGTYEFVYASMGMSFGGEVVVE